MRVHVPGMKICNHEIDEATEKFVEGKGLTGLCKHCGTKACTGEETRCHSQTEAEDEQRRRGGDNVKS